LLITVQTDTKLPLEVKKRSCKLPHDKKMQSRIESSGEQKAQHIYKMKH